MRAIWVLAALVLAGCGDEPQQREPEPPRAAPRAEAPPDARPAIVAFGDSLTAGHGSAANRNYPRFLQQELDRRGLRYRVVNAGVSGDTTGSGLERIEAVIAMKPEVVILEFGGNDGLRGLPVSTTRANLEEMILRLKGAGIRVLLAGMTLPPNYGPQYIREFESAYRDLAAKHHVALIPFLLEGVGGTTEYMQPDGIHPTAEGNRRVALVVMKALEPMLSR